MTLAPQPLPSPPTLARVEAWFAARQWQVADFQREVWNAHARGESGLIHAPTGTGKTLAAWLACLLDPRRHDESLSVLWITPLRALAADTTAGLHAACAALDIGWRVEARTGDTSGSLRARQRRQLPNALVTTPESAALLLGDAALIPAFSRLRAVIVDEWHELLGSKRGVQTELVLSRLRALAPGLQTWGLSATLGNPDQACRTLLGPARTGRCIAAPAHKTVQVETLLPPRPERFPWGGHMGLAQAPRVLDAIRAARGTLVFTNTRAQAERWFETLSAADPALRLTLHHGSLDPALRAQAEQGLREGTLDAVIATSSLDLGVDFSPVDQVIQIGGPKGIARLLQRAGRSGHRPGAASRILCVPTQAIEIAEFAAARAAIGARCLESRRPLHQPLDVLAQHVVTLALTRSLDADQLRAEIRSTAAYADLDDDTWAWVLDFVMRGGAVLHAYPQFHKVACDEHGMLSVPQAQIARRHRMSIGTITSDPRMRVAFQRGGTLGSVEESFISRLRPGDSFTFAGRTLTLVRVKDMTAQVRAGGAQSVVPRWQGGRMPLSSELADSLLELIESGAAQSASAGEHAALAPLLDLQRRGSALPRRDALLVERSRSREGEHLFVFPFAGRHVHEGLSALLAYRLARRTPASFRFSVNDYGFELLTRELPALDEAALRALFTPDDLHADLVASINAAEMARRRFREIARIAGLVFEGYPGAHKALRQVQVSSGLIYDTLERYDPGHRLTQQALREALDQQLDYPRLRATCERWSRGRFMLHAPPRFTPLAFPLWAERLASSLSTEDWRTRVQRMLESLENAAGGEHGATDLQRPASLATPAPATRRRTHARAARSARR